MHQSPARAADDRLCLGAGPALVAIGGLHGHFEFQRPLAEELEKNFRVLCPSLPGDAGGDDAPERAEDVACRLLDTVSAAEMSQFNLCGISMGGALALHMTLQAPERIRRLAVVASFAEYNFLNPELKRLFDFLGRKRLERTGRRIARSTLLALTIRELAVETLRPSTLLPYWERFRKYHSHGDLVWKRLKMIRQIALLDRLADLKLPVLLVAGDRDRLIHPRHTLEMARRISQAQLTITPGSGHLFPFLKPEKLAEVLIKFFRE